MKHLLVTALVVLAILAMQGCGQAGANGSTQQMSNLSSRGSVQHYTLTANSDGAATASVSAVSEISLPLAINAIANASGHRRAILSIGSISCAYVADTTSAYVRQDGSCSTFTPNAPVSVNVGDALTLSIESVDSNNYTSVQADLQAFISN
jgi:hypothetical protein